MKRFFGVFYNCSNGTTGMHDITTENHMFSLEFLRASVKERFPDTGTIAVTGWQEFKSEKDYKEFYEKA